MAEVISKIWGATIPICQNLLGLASPSLSSCPLMFPWFLLNSIFKVTAHIQSSFSDAVQQSAPRLIALFICTHELPFSVIPGYRNLWKHCIRMHHSRIIGPITWIWDFCWTMLMLLPLNKCMNYQIWCNITWVCIQGNHSRRPQANAKCCTWNSSQSLILAHAFKPFQQSVNCLYVGHWCFWQPWSCWEYLLGSKPTNVTHIPINWDRLALHAQKLQVSRKTNWNEASPEFLFMLRLVLDSVTDGFHDQWVF